jgi:cell division protein FtsI (penicillin-binding protein 3)
MEPPESKNSNYRIAGKTGTAQILENGRYEKRYITSFVGYFPAHDPKYSAIVLIKNPRGFYQYGNNVAGPVFKDIADNIYARDINLHTGDGEKENFGSGSISNYSRWQAG